MLNKLKFNNLVISNKKGIQQSRIQTINKLVHKIRKLKSLLEKHPENIKCKERIRKSSETMEILKKLKRVDIMKKVLLMDKPAPAVLTNGLATPEEIGVALLSMNKVMQGLIKRFKAVLQINESKSDEWKQVLMESSKRKRKIERTEEKRRTRLERKQQKAMGRKRQEWLEENQNNINENLAIDSEVNISTIGNWQIEELSNREPVVSAEETAKNKNIKMKETKQENPVAKNTSFPNVKLTIGKRKFERTQNESIEKLSNSDDSNVISDNTKFSGSNKNKNSDDQEVEIEESLEVDPFFITDNGESYMSSATTKKDGNAEEKINEERKHLHMVKLNKSDKKPFEFNARQNSNGRQNENKWNSGRFTQNKRNNRYDKHDQLSRGKWTDRNGSQIRQNEQHKNHTNTNTEKSLHPSWAAKQKSKPIITSFQGKKIRFEDNDFAQQNSNSGHDSKPKKSVNLKVYNPEKESLHPSWAAKQNLKPTIAAFQGKKITFDYDE